MERAGRQSQRLSETKRMLTGPAKHDRGMGGGKLGTTARTSLGRPQQSRGSARKKLGGHGGTQRRPKHTPAALFTSASTTARRRRDVARAISKSSTRRSRRRLWFARRHTVTRLGPRHQPTTSS
ncbi:hypothetical protein MRX96_029319 [Rhipicephalus microplus]